jgi:hypothetical protein
VVVSFTQFPFTASGETNVGGGYPFTGGAHQAVAGTAAYAALDTDMNGEVTGADAPYAPYYPGDDAVDWVGMSLYHWGNTYPWGANVVPEPGKFLQQLTGTYNGNGGNERPTPPNSRTGYASPQSPRNARPGPGLRDAPESGIVHLKDKTTRG